MIEPRGKGKAEAACRANLRNGVRERDWGNVAATFMQYGSYLLMIGEGGPVGEVKVFTHSRL